MPSVVLDNSATLFPVTIRCRDFSFRGVAVGFDCRLSGEIARWRCVEPLETQSGTQHWRHIRDTHSRQSHYGSAGFTRRAARIGDAVRPTQVSTRSGHTPAAGSVGAPAYLSPMLSERGADDNSPRMPGGAGAGVGLA